MRTCKVCGSPNRDYYETIYYKSRGKISFSRLAEKALEKNEAISRKSFERHFKNNHYTPERIQRMLDKGVIDEEVEKVRVETIDILEEIKQNLIGLKALIPKAKNPGDAVAISREIRLTLLDIEHQQNKLSVSSTLTTAELYKELFWAYSILCPKCRKRFWVKLDERLKQKGYI